MAINQLNKEIFQSKFDLRTGGNSASGFPIDIRIQKQSLNFEPVFWGSDKDVSLGGRKRSNIRGVDLAINLDYSLSLEPEKVKTIFNGLTELISNQFTLRFYPNAAKSQYVEMIPTGGCKYSIEYDKTVRVGGADGIFPTLELTSSRFRDNIQDFFQT